jgi:hypothetical protein
MRTRYEYGIHGVRGAIEWGVEPSIWGNNALRGYYASGRLLGLYMEGYHAKI